MTEPKFETPTKKNPAVPAEADQIGSDSTQATVKSPEITKTKKEPSPLDLVLRGEIDDALNRDMLKAFTETAKEENGFSSISDLARQVSPLNLLTFTG